MRGAIFTTNHKEGEKILNQIINDYRMLYDVRFNERIVGGDTVEYRLSNGDSWRMIMQPQRGTLGLRINIAYIDRAIGIDKIKSYILPCLIYKPFSATHYFGEPKPEEKDYFGLLL